MAPLRISFPVNANETAKAFAKWHEAEQWDLSHFEKRVEEAMSHFRQDFQRGPLSPELLGPMYGFFGTFLPAYNIYTGAPALLPPKGTTNAAAKPAVRINFPKNASEAAEAVEKIMQADKKPLVRDDQKLARISPNAKADEKIPRGAKRQLIRDDERRPLKIRIVFGSEKRAQKNATECVPAENAVEKRPMDERRPLKIRFVLGSEKRARIVA